MSAEADVKGGGERFLWDVIGGLSEDFEIACVSPAEGVLADRLRGLGVKVAICPTGWNLKWRNWVANRVRAARLAREVRSFRPQVIYANGGHTNNLAVRLGKHLRCPVVANVHDVFSRVRKDKYAFGRADVAVACSAGVAAQVRPFNSGVRVVYNGVDTKVYSSLQRGAARTSLGLKEGQFAVGFVGTLVAKKGIAEFIETARIIAQEVPEAVFVVVGAPKSGDEAVLAQLQVLVERYHLQKHFHWLGFVEGLDRLLPALDVLLFPAHYEAFGRVIIEAMACGVVPVSSPAAGPKEIIEEGVTGFLRPYEDTKALASAVCCLYRDTALRASMVAAGRKAVLERYSMASMLAGVKQAVVDAMKGS